MGIAGRLRRYAKRLVPRPVLLKLYRDGANACIAALQPDYDPRRKTILILNHFFSQDIKALELANPGFNLVVAESEELFRSARLFFSPAVVNLMAAYADENPASVALYREECRRVLRRLEARFRIDAILTASDIFYWIREFIAVARERGIKTIVLDKEGTISPHDFEFESARIRRFAPYMSDHILVWSEGQRAFWEKVGVPGAQITVTGQPRSDLFFRSGGDELAGLFRREAPLVTFFSYLDIAYIPVPIADGEGLTWARMKRDTHDEILRCATTYPDYNFVIKTHPQQEDLAALQRAYTRDNLVVVGGSSLGNALIIRSDLLIGFQTTALIEAMFLGKPVVYTAWDPNVPRLLDHLLPFHMAEGVLIARTLEEFRGLCDDFCQQRRDAFQLTAEQKAARDAFVNRFLHQPDGKASERLFNALQRVL